MSKLMRTVLIAMALGGTSVAATADDATTKVLPEAKVRAQVPAYEDFARHATLSSPAMSPDGKYLALSVHNEKLGEKGADYQMAVFSLPDLKVVSRLNMAPRTLPLQILWVSDTRLIISIGYDSGTLEAPQATGEVVAVDFDGGHKRTLYTPRSHGRSDIRAMVNALSMPYGYSQIAGMPDKPDGHVYLAITPFESRGTRDVSSWLDRDSLLFDVDSMSGHATQIGKIDRAGMNFVVHDDMARVAYGEDDGMNSVVFISAGKDKPWKQLPASVTGKSMQPLAISRDGALLYSLYSDGGPTQLVTTKLDGSERKVLAKDDFASVGDVLWTPRPDRKPYGAVFDVGRPHVQYVDDDLYTRIHQALSKKFPDEFIAFGGISQDGSRILVVAYSDRDPGSVALLDTKAMNLQPLYQPMPWIVADRMATRQPFRFTASSGTVLDGYLTLPKGDGKHLPMVLLPHGGPIGIRDSWFYEPDAQFLASRGYAVLQVNYRGSAGRGFDFERSGFRQFGTGIMQDQIDAVHWAIDQGYADKDRICIYGGSFGGYSALMVPIRAPNLFKCSIDYAGVSDYTIEFDRSDTRRYKGGRWYFDHAIGTDEATVREISPIFHLDRFNIPVLIVHGEDDPRVPLKNATELRSALDKAGKPYEWLVRPKEGHGFYSETNRADMLKAMDAFLGKYIGNAGSGAK
jgi:dipeptidyl aminopeptidase/acylaminoacyl peptidase